MIFLQILFWFCVIAIAHSYVLYLLVLKILSKREKFVLQSSPGSPIKISILMAAYNEELVIEEKIRSILACKYPEHDFEIIIGSDNSTDATNKILDKLSTEIKQLQFFAFSTRQGKSNIINQLVQHAKGEILILTDANVMFAPETISELVKPFADTSIGLVDTHMKNTGLQKHGISIQEKSYISREVQIKHYESMHWGTMMGPFGGCFALRKSLFVPVPLNFLVDDFYICMQVIKQGYKAINNLDAIVYEDVSNNLAIEYRRKVRIATGNFQNLNVFKSLLWPPFTGLAFSFFSHKVLRWIGPIFLILALCCLIVLAFSMKLYLILLILYAFSFLLPITDFLLKKIGIHNILLRFITHFYSMNLALLIGMIKAFKGVQSNVWKPTQRFQ
jgi:cellulose synthase/poly-beta-1,6-N-acetylglucosamine synthase-like glycosyltransferase